MSALPSCCKHHGFTNSGCLQGRKCPDRLGLCTNLRHIDDFRPPAGYQPLAEPNEAQEKADQPVTNEVFKSGLLWLGVLLVFVVLGSLWATPWPRLVAIVSGVWK
jgi:hypothetical protein